MARRILIVEDDAILCRMLELTLKRTGYEPLTANNGMLGLKLVRSEHPDLVLLDLMLPGIDGFEVLNQIRGDSKTVALPVIVVTGKTQPTDRELAIQLGANGYITKPYRPQEVLAMIETELAKETPITAEATDPGHLVTLVSARSGHIHAVAAHLGAAMANLGSRTVLFNPDPFGTQDLVELEMEAPASPQALPSVDDAEALMGLMQRHHSGLDLLGNFEGSGDIGQLTPVELQQIVDALLANGRNLLVPLSLTPPWSMRQLAPHSKRVLIVVQDQAAALAATRTVLSLLARLQVVEDRIGLILVGGDDSSLLADVGPAVMGNLPVDHSETSPAVVQLAQHLIDSL